MRVSRISITDDLQELCDSWNCLTRGIPFRSCQWLFNWWKHFDADRELYVVTVHDDNDVLLGVAPLFREYDVACGHVLRILGSGEVCTDYLSILSTHEHEKTVVESIAKWLLDAVNDPQHQWDLLELDHIAAADAPIATLVAILAENGCSSHRRAGMNCWRLSLADSWEGVLSESSHNRRRNLRRFDRYLENTPKARLLVVQNHDELPRGMEVLVDLHQRRRESLGEPGCFDSSSFSGFLHAAAADLLQTGNLQLCWIEIDGQPLAAEFNLLDASTVYSYQSGIDPDAMQVSPGHLLTTAVVKQAIRDDHTHYDFLRGDESYKEKWGAKPYGTISYRIAANRLGPQLRHGIWAAGFAMKSWVKGSLILTGMH